MVSRCLRWLLQLTLLATLVHCEGATAESTLDFEGTQPCGERLRQDGQCEADPAEFSPSLGCEAKGAVPCGSRCCCPKERPCWRSTSSQESRCSKCAGAFVQWRETQGFSAERMLAGLLLAPRSAIFIQDLLQACGSTSPFADRSWAWLLARLFAPQLTEMPHIMAWAEDSFWWALGLVHALVGHLLAEASLLLRLCIICIGQGTRSLRRQAMTQEIQLSLQSGLASLVLVAGTLALHLAPGGSVMLGWAVSLLLAWRCWEATVAPFWWFRARRMGMAASHLLVVLALLNRSKNIHFDLFTSFMMLGPGAFLGCKIALEFFVGERTPVFVQRWRFLESSVEQLATLTRRQLRFAPNVIYISSPEELTGEAREIGLDFGGLFRDWLAQLALGLFDAENGLVEHSCVDGTCYARLKPGGDLKRLEAMGKVLGLALRDQQPLGVEICPPLAHLLTHPTLPRALQHIRESLPVPLGQPSVPPMDAEPSDGLPTSPSVSGGEELRRLGFCAEWLRYVSQEEYDFWRRAAHGAAPLDAVDYQGPRSAEGLREHMERKALSSLVLDVSTELEHLWRGLRSVPNVSLPSLEREVKRGLEDAEEERPSKRRRLERSVLQGLISGGPDVPVTLWQGVTRYSPVEATQALDGQRTVMWFWDYVSSLSVEQRSQLLQWITGYRRIPPGGFPAPVPYMTLYLANVGPDRLPTAHTCGLQLDLPRSYADAAQLGQRLGQASAERQFYLV